jgi:hypothetical protein
MKDCPEYVCHRCNIQGHFKRNCDTPRCGSCSRYGQNCVCENDDDMTELAENTNVVKMSETESVLSENASVKGEDNMMCDQCGLVDDCECVFVDLESEQVSAHGNECKQLTGDHAPAPVNAVQADNRVCDESLIGDDQRGNVTDCVVQSPQITIQSGSSENTRGDRNSSTSDSDRCISNDSGFTVVKPKTRGFGRPPNSQSPMSPKQFGRKRSTRSNTDSLSLKIKMMR